MTKELSGKIAFVTGSGRGLGRAMAERLAELGADVAIHDLTWTAPAKYGEAADLDAVAKEIARHGGKVVRGHRQHRRQGRGREDAGRRSRRSSARSTSWSIAPAATSAPRAASPTPTTRSAFRSRTSRR